MIILTKRQPSNLEFPKTNIGKKADHLTHARAINSLGFPTV